MGKTLNDQLEKPAAMLPPGDMAGIQTAYSKLNKTANEKQKKR